MKWTAVPMLIALWAAIDWTTAEQKDSCDHISTEAVRVMCQFLYEIDQRARADAQKEVPSQSVSVQHKKSAYDCMYLTCLCPYYNGGVIAQDGSCILENGKKLQRVTRKEYRRMSDEER
uniref:Uncharacterized protein n=1 Tax=Plectus sambesii TaxID=2011161 RepID=A0A914V4Z2_9BILA